MTCLIDRLHRHAAGEARVANKSTYVEVGVLLIPGDRHSKCCRDRCRGMTCTKGVVFRLVAPQKSAQAVELLDRMKLITPPRQDLVSVGLVPDIPYEPVVR